METVKKNLANLLKVKTLITLPLTAVFCYLAIRGDIPSEFLAVFTTVVGFYFGTQSESRAQKESKTQKEE